MNIEEMYKELEKLNIMYVFLEILLIIKLTL